jgi:hypothetical protein
MNDLNLFFFLAVAGTTLGSISVLFVAFTVWIWSLRADLQVYAPLLDGPRSDRGGIRAPSNVRERAPSPHHSRHIARLGNT